MTSSRQPTSARATQVKPRSAFERMFVWGGILLLLALVVVEFTSRRAHSQAVATLVEKITAAESTGADVKASDVKLAVGHKTPLVEDVTDQYLANGGKRLETFRWFSVNVLAKRELYVYYGAGEDADVLAVATEPDRRSIADLFPPPTPDEIAELKKKAGTIPAGRRATKAPEPSESAEEAGEAPAQAPAGENE